MNPIKKGGNKKTERADKKGNEPTPPDYGGGNMMRERQEGRQRTQGGRDGYARKKQRRNQN